MSFRISTISVIGFALLLTGCRGTEVKPYTAQPRFGQGRTIQLLQDEAQDYGHRVSATASAGIYMATFENDEYVFYRGAAIIVRFGGDTRHEDGGLAVSKHHLGKVFIYTMRKHGTVAVENRLVRSPMVIKP